MKIIDILFPKKCISCKRHIDVSECGLCKNCFRIISPMLSKKGSLNYLLNYDQNVKKILNKAKYSDKSSYIKEIASYMGGELKKRNIPPGIITWVPLHRYDLGKRGYNQSKIIAKEISKVLGFDCICLLKKIKRNKKQASLNKLERFANVRGVYALKPGNKVDISGKTIYIADDIYTTGSTLKECKEQLLRSGAGNIQYLTLALVKSYPQYPQQT